MKFIITTVLAIVIFQFALGQEKKGFIGINIGSSFILNEYPKEAGVGVNLNLINFGYEIKNGFGVAFKWMGSAHIYETGEIVKSENHWETGKVIMCDDSQVRRPAA